MGVRPSSSHADFSSSPWHFATISGLFPDDCSSFASVLRGCPGWLLVLHFSQPSAPLCYCVASLLFCCADCRSKLSLTFSGLSAKGAKATCLVGVQPSLMRFGLKVSTQGEQLARPRMRERRHPCFPLSQLPLPSPAESTHPALKRPRSGATRSHISAATLAEAVQDTLPRPRSARNLGSPCLAPGGNLTHANGSAGDFRALQVRWLGE